MQILCLPATPARTVQRKDTASLFGSSKETRHCSLAKHIARCWCNQERGWRKKGSLRLLGAAYCGIHVPRFYLRSLFRPLTVGLSLRGAGVLCIYKSVNARAPADVDSAHFPPLRFYLPQGNHSAFFQLRFSFVFHSLEELRFQYSLNVFKLFYALPKFSFIVAREIF